MVARPDSAGAWEDCVRLEAEARRMSICDATCRLAGRYLELLDRWRRRMDLTGPMGTRTLAFRFFLEAVPAVPILREDDAPTLDIGSGAGFPGISLAILIPDTRFVLLEPRMRRWSFLRMITRELSLHNVEVQRARLSECRNLEAFRTIVARGVAPEQLSLESTGFLPAQGVVGRVALWSSAVRVPFFPGFECLRVDRVSIPGSSRLKVVFQRLMRSAPPVDR